MPVKHQPIYEVQLPECDGDIVQVKDLSFAYPDGHVALQGVNLNLCEGEKVALVGPNGAGKSTLMLNFRVFSRIQEPPHDTGPGGVGLPKPG